MYMAIFWLSIVMFLGLMIPMCYFAWRYRFKPGRVTPHQTHITVMEITWTVVPLLLCVGMFFWGIIGYMQFAVGPAMPWKSKSPPSNGCGSSNIPDGTRSRERNARPRE